MSTSINYNRAFWNVMRGNTETHSNLAEGADSTGGYVTPDGFREQVGAALTKDNLFRRYGTVISATAPSGVIQAVASTGAAAWTEDGEAIPESADTFAHFNVKSYKLAALSRIKESFVSDNNFDLEGYLSREFARRFGRAEEDAFLNGDGTNLPSGILSATGGTVGVTAADPAKIAYDEIVKLYFSLKAEYRENAVFLMHDETAMLLRTLKDTAGNYLWNATNDTIFSKPVVTSSHMPTIAAGAKSIVFGDLSYYWIVERQPLTVKVLSELYAQQGQIGFSSFERLDGKLILPEAVQVLQQAQ